MVPPLQIPEVGFIPWAITGNPMPPHFHEDPLYKEHFRKWAEDGDVIVASGPKSGTMWYVFEYIIKCDARRLSMFLSD